MPWWGHHCNRMELIQAQSLDKPLLASPELDDKPDEPLSPSRPSLVASLPRVVLGAQTVLVGLLLAAVLLFFPVSGNWTSAPSDNGAHWSAVALWASVYYLLTFVLMELQMKILLAPSNWSWWGVWLTGIAFFCGLWGVLYVGLNNTASVKTVLLCPAVLGVALPIVHFDLLLRNASQSSVCPVQEAWASFDWLWHPGSLHSGFEAAVLVLIIQSYLQWAWLQLISYIYQNIESNQILYAVVTLIFFGARAGCNRMWTLYGRKLENASYQGRFELFTVLGSECIIAVFFRLALVHVESWTDFSVVCIVSVFAKSSLFRFQTSKFYFETVVPTVLRWCGRTVCSKRCYEKNLQQQSVSSFASAFSDVLAGIVILLVAPVATTTNNRAFYTNHSMPAVSSVAGVRLMQVYGIQLVVDVVFGGWKHWHLQRICVQADAEFERVVHRILESRGWSVMMILLTAHFIGDITIAIVDVKIL